MIVYIILAVLVPLITIATLIITCVVLGKMNSIKDSIEILSWKIDQLNKTKNINSDESNLYYTQSNQYQYEYCRNCGCKIIKGAGLTVCPKCRQKL
mgnify:CR=1 FL=1